MSNEVREGWAKERLDSVVWMFVERVGNAPPSPQRAAHLLRTWDCLKERFSHFWRILESISRFVAILSKSPNSRRLHQPITVAPLISLLAKLHREEVGAPAAKTPSDRCRGLPRCSFTFSAARIQRTHSA